MAIKLLKAPDFNHVQLEMSRLDVMNLRDACESMAVESKRFLEVKAAIHQAEELQKVVDTTRYLKEEE